MKKILVGALLFSFFNLSAIAAGSAVGTAMQVSFVVQEACTVQVADGSRAAPAVNCSHEAPVRITAAAPSLQSESSQTASVDGGWQIYF